jgi:DsbC/DsbD-like thiol-disulfide interchange protein
MQATESFMKKFTLVLSSLFLAMTIMAQSAKQVNWEFTSKKVADKTYELHLNARVNPGWHIYAQNVGVDGPLPTTFTFVKNPLAVTDGKAREVGKVIKKKEEVWGGTVNFYENNVDFVQTVKLKGNVKTNVAGKVEFMVCNDKMCLPPSDLEFKVAVGG